MQLILLLPQLEAAKIWSRIAQNLQAQLNYKPGVNCTYPQKNIH